MSGMPGIAGETAPGWFGKLPCLGDFASRRLSIQHREAWDQWLSQSLTSTRAHWGEAWLARYLQAPLWFWLQSPGDHATFWSAGTLMPSVDQAGRYFPLVVVQPLERAPADVDDWQQLEATLQRLAAASLATLAPIASLDRFDTQLSASVASCTPSQDNPSITSWLLAQCSRQLGSASLWWTGQRDSARIEARWPLDALFLLEA